MTPEEELKAVEPVLRAAAVAYHYFKISGHCCEDIGPLYGALEALPPEIKNKYGDMK